MGWYGLSSPEGNNIVIVMFVFGVLEIITVLLRFWARTDVKAGWHLDDYLMLLAALSIWVTVACGTAMVLYGGIGFHAMVQVPMADIIITLKLLIVAEIMYAVELGLIKVSLLLLYLRLFGVDSKFKIIIWSATFVVVAWAFSIILEAFLLCSPFPANYDPTIPGVCGDRNAAFVSAGVLNMITDLMVMAIPVPYIISLNLRLSRKIALIVCFCLGILYVVGLPHPPFSHCTQLMDTRVQRLHHLHPARPLTRSPRLHGHYLLHAHALHVVGSRAIVGRHLLQPAPHPSPARQSWCAHLWLVRH
jgi:hypothetical protein